MTHTSVRFSPGFCEAGYGAVESLDWRDRHTVGVGRQDDPLGLRKAREAVMFQVRQP